MDERPEEEEPGWAAPAPPAPLAPPPLLPPPPPPPPFPPGYPATHPGARTASTNGFAVASLVLGILGWLFCVCWILALVFGYIGRGQIDSSGGRQKGRGMATAGIVLGYVWLGLTVIYVIVVVGTAS